MEKSKKIKIDQKKLITYIVLILLTLTFLFPYLWLISSSMKTPEMIFNPKFSIIPRDENGNIRFNFINYKNAADYLNLKDIFSNTFLVCVANTLLNLLFNSMAAYAFARIKFQGRTILFKIFISSLMIPGAVMLIPNLMIVNKLGIYDTLWALVMPFSLSIYNIFLLRQQFYAISVDLEEAAIIDGCGRLRLFFVIALPLVSPMLVVQGITTFMWNYNNFLWPLVATQSQEVSTLARSLGDLVAAGSNNVKLYPVMLAGAVIVSMPLIVIFFILQKFIFRGIQAGAVK